MSKDVLVFVGTYTRPAPYIKHGNGQGIYTFRLNTETGALTQVALMEGIDSPSYLNLDPTGRYLYATSEVWGWHEGVVTAFAVNRATGELTYINKQPTQGSITCYVAVEPSGRCVLAANYWDRQSITMFPVRADGGLAPASSTIEHGETPVGTVPARQEKSHAHSIVPDPMGQRALVCDLGLDKIMVYGLDIGNGKFVPNDPPFMRTHAGAGPRHLVFHPNGRFAYVVQELDSTVSALSYDAATGTIEVLQTVPALPEGYSGDSTCSDIHITPDGKYVYAANRGHDSLAIYAVDQASGHLTVIGHHTTGGQIPRGFAIDPTGKFVLAGNQDTDNILVLRIDPATGTLTEVQDVPCPTPVCLKMLSV